MCTYIVETTKLMGAAKGPQGWVSIDTANVYFDHPFHAPLDHSLNIDFMNQSDGLTQRIAVELSADSAMRLVESILAALKQGEAAHF